MKQNWNLENIFSGGSESKAFASFLDKIENGLKKIDTLALKEALLASQSILQDLMEAGSFISCLLAQNTADQKAKELQAQLSTIRTDYQKIKIRLDENLKAFSDEAFEGFLKDDELKDLKFHLKERRILASKRLSFAQEALIEDLSEDGYHGWGQYYDTLVDSLKFPFRLKELSQGQIENCLHHEDRTVRKEAFDSYVSVYQSKIQHFSEILNHLGGFRLKKYKARGWKSVLEEPCDYSRLSISTLETMWDVVAKNRVRFLPFLQKKAELMGVEKLSWYDLEAPLGQSKSQISYDEGVGFILENFRSVSPKLADFSKRALESGWVEAEDRPGKRPGGFCTRFPKKKETRIFMTYSNTVSNCVTLAHELGHAFHGECCSSLPYFNQIYGMNVAETASNMAELIVSEAALERAEHPQERLSLLNGKLNRTIAYLMNLNARFLFETRFYQEREKGFLLPERISTLMLEAQKEAYSDSLQTYHPLFFASKLHFYLTEIPFYNFPYTFGYLFSLGVYTHLRKDKEFFEERYIALLKDTGCMTSEELALKHLHKDLQEPEFWQAAIDYAAKDVMEFTGIGTL